MAETNDRAEQFRAEIKSMRLKDPATARDTLLLRAGALLMVAGVAVAFVAFFLSHNTSDSLNQRDDIVLALAGVAVTVLGTGVWLRYSATGFLRFWLARLIFEQRLQGDRLAGRVGPDHEAP